MAGLKLRTFVVQATAEQATRWQRAAIAEGHRSVGRWLEDAADAYLEKSKARPLRLAWRRRERFRVVVLDGREVEVSGAVSVPFGVFRGSLKGPGKRGCKTFSLVHLPDRRILATLAFARDCKALAAALASSPVNWQDPEAK